MAVTFTSFGYDTSTANPYTEAAWADAHPSIGTGTYGVRSPLDWKVTAVAGQDRTVSINAGWGFGCGVIDKTVANDTIQLDTIASGSRWDLIAVRRDWTPTAGVSQFVKINGGATATIPGGRNSTRGNIDDQPLALVQVSAGVTQPTGLIDLRTFTGDGGGLIGMDDLCRSFLNRTGTRINIGGVDWLRVVGPNDTPVWVENNGITVEGAPDVRYSQKYGTVTVNTDANGAASWTFGTPFPTAIYTANMTGAYSAGLGVVLFRYSETLSNKSRVAFFCYDTNGNLLKNINGIRVSFTAIGA